MPRIWIRKRHRWVALVVVHQPMPWPAGRRYVSRVPIEGIRGEHLVDCQDRGDFNHPLLTFAALLARLALLSDLLRRWNSTPLRRQARRRFQQAVSG